MCAHEGPSHSSLPLLVLVRLKPSHRDLRGLSTPAIPCSSFLPRCRATKEGMRAAPFSAEKVCSSRYGNIVLWLVATVQVRVYMHPYVCANARLNLNLITMVLLFFGRIGGNTPLPIRALACAFAMWALVCARGRSRSHLREHIP